MKWEEIRISLKDVIGAGVILVAVLATWYNTTMKVELNGNEIRHLKNDIEEVKKEFKTLKAQVQGVMGYAIFQGWRPGGEWLFPEFPMEGEESQPP